MLPSILIGGAHCLYVSLEGDDLLDSAVLTATLSLRVHGFRGTPGCRSQVRMLARII